MGKPAAPNPSSPGRKWVHCEQKGALRSIALVHGALPETPRHPSRGRPLPIAIGWMTYTDGPARPPPRSCLSQQIRMATPSPAAAHLPGTAYILPFHSLRSRRPTASIQPPQAFFGEERCLPRSQAMPTCHPFLSIHEPRVPPSRPPSDDSPSAPSRLRVRSFPKCPRARTNRSRGLSGICVGGPLSPGRRPCGGRGGADARGWAPASRPASSPRAGRGCG